MVVSVDGRDTGILADAAAKDVRPNSDVIDPLSMKLNTSDVACTHGIARVEEGLTILLDIKRVALDVDLGSLDQAAQLAEAA